MSIGASCPHDCLLPTHPLQLSQVSPGQKWLGLFSEPVGKCHPSLPPPPLSPGTQRQRFHAGVSGSSPVKGLATSRMVSLELSQNTSSEAPESIRPHGMGLRLGFLLCPKVLSCHLHGMPSPFRALRWDMLGGIGN